MTRLLHSSKFWIAIIDAVMASLAIVLAWFLKPEAVGQVLTLIGYWQPVFIIVIAGIAWEDGKEKEANQTSVHNYTEHIQPQPAVPAVGSYSGIVYTPNMAGGNVKPPDGEPGE